MKRARQVTVARSGNGLLFRWVTMRPHSRPNMSKAVLKNILQAMSRERLQSAVRRTY